MRPSFGSAAGWSGPRCCSGTAGGWSTAPCGSPPPGLRRTPSLCEGRHEPRFHLARRTTMSGLPRMLPMTVTEPQLLDLIAEEAIIDRDKLNRDATLGDLGISSLD